jgi:hypothetical protein
MSWEPTGKVANQKGDLFGNAPHRLIRFGYVSIAASRVPAALEAGWRLREEQGDDPEFARLERTEAEREAR